jgi:hypothetical protein
MISMKTSICGIAVMWVGGVKRRGSGVGSCEESRLGRANIKGKA